MFICMFKWINEYKIYIFTKKEKKLMKKEREKDVEKLKNWTVLTKKQRLLFLTERNLHVYKYILSIIQL